MSTPESAPSQTTPGPADADQRDEGTHAMNEQEQKKLSDEQDVLVQELRDGKIKLKEFERRWKELVTRNAGDGAEAAEVRQAKLKLYEAYVEGNLTRGGLDRELDKLHSETQPHEPPPSKTPRQRPAEKIVRTYMWWSAGGGLIPIPVLDLAAVFSLQLLMLRGLCKLYGVPFSEEWGKSALTALAGGVAPSYFKAVPGVGTAVGVATGPIFNAASTYAVGKVFTQHFESGGTLLTFNPSKMKKYFEDYYHEGAATAKS